MTASTLLVTQAVLDVDGAGLRESGDGSFVHELGHEDLRVCGLFQTCLLGTRERRRLTSPGHLG